MTLAATRCGVSYPVLVDEEDALLVAPFHWNIGTDGYAGCTGPGGKRLLMHRLILDAPPNLYTDHINGDRRDNRRANLRLCTPQENNRNRPVPNKNGYKGVLFHSRPANKKYQARRDAGARLPLVAHRWNGSRAWWVRVQPWDAAHHDFWEGLP